MKKLYLLLSCMFCLNACSKTEDAAIFIRVENQTAQNFKEVIVNNQSFANVDASSVTSYKSYESALSLPAAIAIDNNNDTILIGNWYFDWLGYLAVGKYTLRIADDTSTYSNFNCVYIKN